MGYLSLQKPIHSHNALSSRRGRECLISFPVVSFLHNHRWKKPSADIFINRISVKIRNLPEELSLDKVNHKTSEMIVDTFPTMMMHSVQNLAIWLYKLTFTSPILLLTYSLYLCAGVNSQTDKCWQWVVQIQISILLNRPTMRNTGSWRGTVTKALSRTIVKVYECL